MRQAYFNKDYGYRANCRRDEPGFIPNGDKDERGKMHPGLHCQNNEEALPN